MIQGLTWGSVGLAGRCSDYFRVSGIGEVPVQQVQQATEAVSHQAGQHPAVDDDRGAGNALAGELNSGRLGGAGLDVFAQEPLPGDSPLLSTPNTILSPHVA